MKKEEKKNKEKQEKKGNNKKIIVPIVIVAIIFIFIILTFAVSLTLTKKDDEFKKYEKKLENITIDYIKDKEYNLSSDKYSTVTTETLVDEKKDNNDLRHFCKGYVQIKSVSNSRTKYDAKAYIKCTDGKEYETESYDSKKSYNNIIKNGIYNIVKTTFDSRIYVKTDDELKDSNGKISTSYKLIRKYYCEDTTCSFSKSYQPDSNAITLVEKGKIVVYDYKNDKKYKTNLEQNISQELSIVYADNKLYGIIYDATYADVVYYSLKDKKILINLGEKNSNSKLKLYNPGSEYVKKGYLAVTEDEENSYLVNMKDGSKIENSLIKGRYDQINGLELICVDNDYNYVDENFKPVFKYNYIYDCIYKYNNKIYAYDQHRPYEYEMYDLNTKEVKKFNVTNKIYSMREHYILSYLNESKIVLSDLDGKVLKEISYKAPNLEVAPINFYRKDEANDYLQKGLYLSLLNEDGKCDLYSIDEETNEVKSLDIDYCGY